MKIEVFFYGLFMDLAILGKNGIQPSNPRSACLEDYTLKIGNRASLLPCPNEKAYGLVMSIDKDSIDQLYAEASVADYIPEPVTIVTDGNTKLSATCYNLPASSLTGTNTSYAQALLKLATALGFPTDYLKKIERMTQP